MTIENLGVKLYSGTKADRKSDSLGSTADGVNTGITLVKGGGSVTGSPTTDLSSAIGSWTKVPDSGSFLAVDSGNNEIDVAYGSSANNAINYDLGGGSNLGTKFTVRFEYQITGYSGLGNYMQFAVGLTSGTSNCIQNSNDFAVASNTAGSSLNRWRIHTGKNDQVSGGAGNGVVSAFTTTSSATTYYMEIARDGEFFQITFFTDNSYSTVSESIQGSSSGTYNLRYLQASIYQESSGSGTYTSSIRNIKYWNNQAKFNGDVKLGTGSYSFDGTNDYVQAGTVSDFIFLHNGNPNTVTFWFKKDTPESGDVREIFGTADGTNDGMEVVYLDRSSASETRKVKIEFTNTSGQQVGIYYAQEFFPNDSNWHHYAIVSDLSNNYLKAYVDGVEKTADSSYPTFTGTPTSANQQHVLNIGRRNSGTFYLDGDLDDMSFWDRNLSTTEISDLVNETEDTPTVSTLNATNGTTNWSADTAKLTKSGNTITFSATGSSNDEEIYYDLTSTSDDKWTLRFKADFTSIGAGTNATHQQLQFGIFDSASPSGNASGDAIMFYLSSAGNVSNAVNGVNGGTSDITSTNNTPIASSGSAVTYYIELQRTSSSAIQAKVFSDEYVTQVGSTLSKTGLSGITGLRYLMVRLWGESGAGNGAVGSVTAMKFWNNKTSVKTANGALVSSLTNKSELKAYYSMDTEGTQAWGGFTKTDDYDISSYETQPRGCFVSTDGTYFYVVGDQGHSIDQFTMSTPYDLTTISHTRVETIGTNYPRGIYFKEDGTKMFIIFYGGVIKRWTLNTAWDISSMGSPDQSDTFESDSGDYNSVIGLYFKPDGTKFYVCVGSDNAIKQYDCGSAWDVSSMSGSDVATRDSLQGDPSGLFISSDGLRLWYCDYDTDKVYQWNFATAWDITTGSVDSTSYSVEANPFGFTMKTDGTKFYLVNDGEDEIQEFTGGKSCPNDFSTTSALDGVTGVRTNSIFQQTDNTPSYWWFNGTSWVLDGTSTWDSNFAQFSTEEEGQAKWITSDSTRLNYGGVSGSSSDDKKYIDWDLRNDNSNDTIYYDLGKTVNSSKWVLRFKINFSDLASNTSTQGLLGLSSITGSADSTQDFLGIAFLTGDDQIRGISTDSNPNGIPSTYSASIDWQEDTDYYIQIERTSATAFKAYVRTGSYSGTTLASITNGVTTSAIGGLRYIKIQNRITNNSPSPRLTIQEVGLLDGFSEWE